MSTAQMIVFCSLAVLAVLITCIAWPGIETSAEWVSWWGWRRWKIYCPRYPVEHLFESRHALGATLFAYDEQFISPCTLNGVNCGGAEAGKWRPRIFFMSMEMPEGFDA